MLQRASLAVVRRLGKTTVLFLMVFVTMMLILSGLSMQRTVNQAIAALRSSFPAYIQLNGEGLDEARIPTSLSVIQGVDEVVIMEQHLLHVADLDVVPGLYTSGGDMKRAKDLRVIALSQSKYQSDFLYRLFVLNQGRHIESDDKGVIIISETMARLNSLSLGDTVKLSTADNPQSEVMVEIIGIFDCITKAERTIMAREYEIQENYFFTDLVTPQKIAGNAQQISAMLIVRDATQLENVTQGILQLGNGRWNDKNIAVNNNAYETAGGPLERVNSLLQGLVLVVVIISALLLTLTLLLWTRGRKWETGILLSIGIGKAAIVGQYWLEAIWITITASFFACGIGSFIVWLSRRALSQIAQVDVLDVTITVSVTPWIALLTSIIGIVIVSFAVVLATIPIVRMKPKEILSSGN